MKSIILARTILTIVLAAPLAASARAAAPLDAIAPLVNEQTLFVARIDLQRADVDAIFDLVTEAVAKFDDAEAMQARWQAVKAERIVPLVEGLTEAGADAVYIMVTLGEISDVPFSIAVPGTDHATISNWLGKVKASPSQQVRIVRGIPVLASPRLLHYLESMQPAANPSLAAAFRAAPAAALQVAIAPNDDTRRVIDELLPQLPESLGGGPSAVLTRGVIWAAASSNVAPDLAMTLTIQSRDQAAAKAFDEFLRTLLEKNLPEIRKKMPGYAAALDLIRFTRQGDRLVMQLTDAQLRPVVFDALMQEVVDEREAAQRRHTVTIVRQIVLAAHQYAADHEGMLPTRFINLLPYLEEYFFVFHPEFDNWSAEKRAAFVDASTPFVLRPNLGKFSDVKNPGETILAFEKLAKSDGKTLIVGYADGHVVTHLLNDHIRNLIKEQTGKTLEEWSQPEDAR